ncbi:fungal-specific transcription factor domain-containing protein [Aspergillus venezuelensis]
MPKVPTKASSSKRAAPPTSKNTGGRLVMPNRDSESPGPAKEHRRSRSGCFTCRLRRKKCDEERPTCQTCHKLGLRCDYKTPSWWSTTEQRKRQNDRVKTRIRQTKIMEKEGSLKEYMDRMLATCQRTPASTGNPEAGNSLYAPESATNTGAPNPYASSYAEPYVEPYREQFFEPYSAPYVEPYIQPYTDPYADTIPTPVSATSTSSMTSFIPPPLSITPFNFTSQPDDTIPTPVSATSTSSMTSFIPPQLSITPFSFEAKADDTIPTPVSATSTSSMTSFIPPSVTPFNFESNTDNDVWPTSVPIAGPSYSNDAPFEQVEETNQNDQFNQVNQVTHVSQVNQISQINPMGPVVPPIMQQQQMTAPVVTTNGWFNHTTAATVTAPQPAPNMLFPSQTQTLPRQQRMNQMNPYAQGYGRPQPPPLSSQLQSMIPIDESDRPLLNHFVDNVIPVVFPMSSVLDKGPGRFREILNSVKTNKSYMHCCLSVSAIHLKTSMGMADEMDYDIMKHRYEAICQLTKAHSRAESNKAEALNATLAMIIYNCSVGTSEDYLHDIPWHAHFRGVSDLVKTLHCAPSRLNVSLIAWIDILGATMLGSAPHFAHTYLRKHLRGVSSGLQTLTGCDDRIMYLISEIACLEYQKKAKPLDNASLNNHINALISQLDWTEPLETLLYPPFTPNGAIIPDMLVKIVTTLFRTAARIYLLSLSNTFDPYNTTVMDLVSSIVDTLKHLPAGIHGFDRALVWPLFMAGAHAVPSSQFRKVMAERVTALGYLGDFGSFGRMYRVLKAIWRVADSAPTSPSSSLDAADHGDSFNYDLTQAIADPESISTEKIPHWREVMRRNKWDYLLM